MNTELANAIISCIGIGFLFFIRFLTRRTYLDKFREDLFASRDRLFDLSLDPKSTLEFDSTAYRSTEEHLCRLLRFAHFVSFAAYVLMKIVEKVSKDSDSANDVNGVEQALSTIDDEYTHSAVGSIWLDVQYSMFYYLKASSLTFLLWAGSMHLVRLLRSRPHDQGNSQARKRAVKEYMVRQNEPVLRRIESSAYTVA